MTETRPPSVYANVAWPELAQLHKPARCHTLIVGAGIAGLSVAASLIEAGERDLIVIDAQTVGFGASGRNGGFVFAGYSLGEAALLRRCGPDQANRLYARTVAGVERIRTRARDYKIDCQLQDSGVIWASWFNRDPAMQARAKLLREVYGVSWDHLDATALEQFVHSARYCSGYREPNALHLDPLAYCRGLANMIIDHGGRIYGQTPALTLSERRDSIEVTTRLASIEAERVIVTTGAYGHGLHRSLDRSHLAIATYVVSSTPNAALKDCIPGNAAIYDSRFAFDYYRRMGDSLLWGGRISVSDARPQAIASLLRRDIARVFPQLADIEISHAWSGLMSYARHEMPQVGQLSPRLYYAQGFGGHGLAPATGAALAIADALQGDHRALDDFAQFGLTPCFGRLGLLAAQCRYWQLQAADAWQLARR